MNSIIEKEKKLNDALSELKNLDLSNPDLKNNIDIVQLNALMRVGKLKQSNDILDTDKDIEKFQN